MLALAQRLLSERSGSPETIPVRHHATRYEAAAATLVRQVPLELSGDLRLGDVLEAYRRLVKRPDAPHGGAFYYEDMAALTGWLGDNVGVQRVVREGVAVLSRLPPDALSAAAAQGGWSDLERWQERVLASAMDRGQLLTTLDEEIRSLGLEQLPVSELLPETDRGADEPEHR